MNMLRIINKKKGAEHLVTLGVTVDQRSTRKSQRVHPRLLL